MVEELEEKLIGTLRATDRDVWSLGYGPPFNFSLAKINKPDVLKLFTLKSFPCEYMCDIRVNGPNFRPHSKKAGNIDTHS